VGVRTQPINQNKGEENELTVHSTRTVFNPFNLPSPSETTTKKKGKDMSNWSEMNKGQREWRREKRGRTFFSGDTIFPGVFTEEVLDLGVTVVDAEDLGPLGPGVVGGAGLGRLREELKVRHRLGPVPQRRPDTVVPRIPPANHDHIFALGR
jgi:hypothetical protein